MITPATAAPMQMSNSDSVVSLVMVYTVLPKHLALVIIGINVEKEFPTALEIIDKITNPQVVIKLQVNFNRNVAMVGNVRIAVGQTVRQSVSPCVVCERMPFAN